ncbi:MAG: hypothetical protein ACKO5K_11210 [Armatimonadota bacterium]
MMGNSAKVATIAVLIGLVGFADAGTLDPGLTLEASGTGVYASPPVDGGNPEGDAVFACIASGSAEQGGAWATAFDFDSSTGVVVLLEAGANARTTVSGPGAQATVDSIPGSALVLDSRAPSLTTVPVSVSLQVDGRATVGEAPASFVATPLGDFVVTGNSLSGKTRLGSGVVRIEAKDNTGAVILRQTQPVSTWIGFGRSKFQVAPAGGGPL